MNKLCFWELPACNPSRTACFEPILRGLRHSVINGLDPGVALTFGAWDSGDGWTVTCTSSRGPAGRVLGGFGQRSQC